MHSLRNPVIKRMQKMYGKSTQYVSTKITPTRSEFKLVKQWIRSKIDFDIDLQIGKSHREETNHIYKRLYVMLAICVMWRWWGKKSNASKVAYLHFSQKGNKFKPSGALTNYVVDVSKHCAIGFFMLCQLLGDHHFHGTDATSNRILYKDWTFFKCPHRDCEYFYTHMKDIRNHVACAHAKDRKLKIAKLKCPHCPKEYLDRNSLKFDTLQKSTTTMHC